MDLDISYRYGVFLSYGLVISIEIDKMLNDSFIMQLEQYLELIGIDPLMVYVEERGFVIS